MNPNVEIVASSQGQQLAYLVRATWAPKATEFVTPDAFSLQMGVIVYAKGEAIQPHMHLPIVREVHGTSEVVSVRSGECEVDLYDDERRFVASRTLRQGDIVLLLGGAHGFRMNEDTVLFEVKQGPYVDGRDKERF
jgi:quercetin dioxygenase-like cupin family protein